MQAECQTSLRSSNLVCSSLQLLLNRTEEFTVETDRHEPGGLGCEVVANKVVTLSTIDVAP